MSKPSKAQKIRDYIASHPDKSVKQVASALRVIPAYVYKVKSELKPKTLPLITPKIEDQVYALTVGRNRAAQHAEPVAAIPKPAALDVQVGGAHYKNKRIQPVEFSYANNLNGLEASIVKRITRWRDKDGFQDLEKIKHEVDLLIELEKKYGSNA
jgi:hypothetical protein